MDFDQIAKQANIYTQSSVNFLREIIAIPSISRNEGAVIERIGNEMSDVGFDEVSVDPMGNLLGRVGSGKHIIAMDGHVDTVGVGNIENWAHDPFKGKLEKGVVYGRGASDMKGAMAAMIYGAKIIKQLALEDDFTLYITGTVQEEDCDGLCWQYIINEDKIVPQVVVIGEPTNLQLYRGQRGRMELEIIVEGISSHGAAPEKGENAIYKITPIIKDIDKMNTLLKSNSFLGKGSITITRVRSSGPSLNAVPDLAAIYLDRRVTSEESIESIQNQLKSLNSFQEAHAKIAIPKYDEPSYTGLQYEMDKFYHSWLLPENHPVLLCALDLYHKIFEKKIVPGKWGFSTNGVATAGLFKIPTFGFGPANEIHAHTVDDQCPVAHLTEAMKFYAAFPKYYVSHGL